MRVLFYKRLRARAYPRKLLLDIFTVVRYRIRDKYLAIRDRVHTARPLFLTIPFTRSIETFKVQHILRKYSYLLELAAHEDGSEPLPKPIVVYSKGRSIFDIVRTYQKRARQVDNPL